MVTKICDSPLIHRILIPLPENPLKSLNAYVLQSEGETLVIDSGFRRAECEDALRKGLAQLGASIESASLLLTHLHSDHTGLVDLFARAGSPIYMNGDEYDYYIHQILGRDWEEEDNGRMMDGLPRDEVSIQQTSNPAFIYAPSTTFDIVRLADGQPFRIGDVELLCIETPGHTPHHICLYIPSVQVMFLGDHVLFDITPNITRWAGVDDSLGDYMRSLDKISAYPMRIALPSHRESGPDVYSRIEQVKIHHEKRLASILDVAQKRPGQSAYQIASQLSWHMRGAGWADFPVTQKWFALGETLSHLDLLCLRGQLSVAFNGEMFVYTPAQVIDTALVGALQ